MAHDNIHKVTGIAVSLVEGTCQYVESDFYSHGSLQDVLTHDIIRLDWTFKHSMLRDIVLVRQDLHFIHPRYHSTVQLWSNKLIIVCSIRVWIKLSSQQSAADSRRPVNVYLYGGQSLHRQDQLAILDCGICCHLQPTSESVITIYDHLLWRARITLFQNVCQRHAKRSALLSVLVCLSSIIQ